MACSPQRYLANNRNHILGATLAPSSVEPVENLVREEPLERDGSAAVALTGAYEGAEEALYEIEVVDTAADVPTISAPVYAGAGSSRLTGIAATGLDAQDIVLELVDAGLPASRSALEFEGVTISSREIGANANLIRIIVDQSELVFTPTDYSLLVDLLKGQGGATSGVEGAGFDWETAVLGADDFIPGDAKRVAFGDDRSVVYLAYKAYESGKWLYHFVPEIQRDVPKGTPVLFVTGGRTLTITDGTDTEPYPDCVTVYDFLSQVRAGSVLVSVDGVVANDRSPDGQAARELLTRTDAHIEPPVYSGSSATGAGFTGAFANDNARTELIIARCFATTGRDHPQARLGAERWEISSSLGGKIGEAVTGVAFAEPEDRFGFTIKQVLPAGFGVQKGRFALVGIDYAARTTAELEPPICPVSMKLGSAAIDQTITLKWTKRPSGECDCSKLPAPEIGGPCLDTEDTTQGEESDMGYSWEAQSRLKGLYDWGATCAATAAKYVAGKERDGIPETTYTPTGTESGNQQTASGGPGQGEVTYTGNSWLASPPEMAADEALVDTSFADDVPSQIHTVLGIYERALATIDEVTDSSLRYTGFDAWDAALVELTSDTNSITRIKNFTVEKYRALMSKAIAYAGVSPLGKTDASTLDSGDECWRDYGDPYYFTVEGSVLGGYAPLFANHPYYSSRRATEEGQYFATHEFGLQVNVQCPHLLKEGDTVVLSIGDAAWPATYQVGDTITMAVIASQAQFLAGGVDESVAQTWSVTGSVEGPFAPWIFTPGDSATDYNAGGLSWDIVRGGIPNAKGDRILFSIEGGHYQWRKDGGSWTGPLPIPTAPTALDDGLYIAFQPGASPSFATGDLYKFTALQPWAVSNVRRPKPERWKWLDETAGAWLDIDFGSVKSLDAFAIAGHTIPEGAAIELFGGDAAANEWTESITWRAGAIVHLMDAARTARYLRLALSAAGGGAIGWLWAGQALATALSANVQLRSSFKMARTSGPLYQDAATLGKTRSAVVRWSEAALEEDDGQALIAMFDHVKANGDEALIVVPNVNRPEDAVYGQIVADEIEFTELSDQNRTSTARRRYSGEFTVQGLWQR